MGFRYRLTMVTIVLAPPGRVLTPFPEFDRRSTIVANHASALQRWSVNVSLVAALFHAPPKEWFALPFAGHNLSPTDRTCRRPIVVFADQVIEAECPREVLNHFPALSSLHYFLGVSEAQRVERSKPQNFVVHEYQFFVHPSLMYHNGAPRYNCSPMVPIVRVFPVPGGPQMKVAS